LAIHGASGCDRKQTSLGLGTGIVLDGKLFAGAGGGAGELDRLFTQWFETHYPNGDRPRTLAEMTDRHIREFVVDLGENFSHIINYLAPEKLVVQFDEEPPSPAFVKRLREAMQANLLPGTDRNFSVEMCTRGIDLLLDGGLHRLRQLYFAPSDHLFRQIWEAFDRR
jgi:predicted NBD/HSP70 family sugar kinase